MAPASACSPPQVTIIALAAALSLFMAACDRSPSGQAQAEKEVQGAPIKASVAKPNPASRSSEKLASTVPSDLSPASNHVASASPPAVTTPVPIASAPSAAAASNAGAPTAPTPISPGQSLNLGFDQLAGYTFEVSDELLGPVTNDVAAVSEKTNAKIPETVKSFDRKKVALKGFMLPLKVEGGLVTEMLIMKDQSMCCYGTTPRINDWVSVKMKKKGVRPTMDLPVTLIGTMRVGEMRENGYLVGIYSMDGEEMDAPEVK